MSSCNSGCSMQTPAKKQCPIRMMDGRAFTSYEPRCAVSSQLNSFVQNKPGSSVSSYDIRMELQKNGLQHLETMRLNSMKDILDCIPCKMQEREPMLDEKYTVRCNAVSCERGVTNPKGLGDGRYM